MPKVVVTFDAEDIKSLKEEVEEVRSCIDDFGYDFMSGVKYDVFCRDFPNVRKVVLKYLSYIDFDWSDENVRKHWEEGDLLDWESDWDLILEACDRAIAGKKIVMRELVKKYYDPVDGSY